MEEKDIQILKEMFRESEARMEARMEAMMDRKIDALRTETNEKFESIDQKFDAIDKRFESIDQKFDAIDKRFEAMDKKIEDTAAQVQRNTAILMDAEFSRRFDLIEEQLQLLMEKMTADWVLGEVRLISSASSSWQLAAPSRYSNRLLSRLYMVKPVMSEGSVSGVN